MPLSRNRANNPETNPVSNRGTNPALASPAARRTSRRALDARLVVGLAIIVGSILLGNLVVGAGEEKVTLWAAAHDMAAGARIAAEDLAPVEVVLAAPQVQNYLRDDQGQPSGRLLAPVLAGQLLPASAVSERQQTSLLLTIPVQVDRVPPELGPGIRVDIWSSPGEGAAGAARLVRRSVLVHSVTPLEDATGDSRSVVLEVPGNEVDGAGELITAGRSGVIDLVMADQGAAGAGAQG